MTICMQDVSAVLYALLRLRGEVKALKLEKKASVKYLSWLLMGLAISCVYEVYSLRLKWEDRPASTARFKR